MAIKSMRVNDMISWYQKKIATYDKEPWEKTVEEKILYAGFRGGGVRMKNAKLKTDLIDVDLVRGSTFPKAKPKQSLLTVVRLALLRFLLLPLYANWWMRQTCSSLFLLLFLLYITQMMNWAIYTLHINSREMQSIHISINNQTGYLEEDKLKMDKNTLSTQIPETNEQAASSIISLSELFIPMILSFFLSLIHSQIVATNNLPNGCKGTSSTSSSSGRPAVPSSSSGGGGGGVGTILNTNRCNREMRLRRRKKLFKIRSQDLQEGSGVLLQQVVQGDNNTLNNDDNDNDGGEQMEITPSSNRTPDLIKISQSSQNTSSNVTVASYYSSCSDGDHEWNNIVSKCHHHQRRSSSSKKSVDLVELADSRTTTLLNNSDYTQLMEHALNESNGSVDTEEEEEEEELESVKDNQQKYYENESQPVKRSVRIDDCVQEINCDDNNDDDNDDNVETSMIYLQSRQSPPHPSSSIRGGLVCEDDGFESFNGKSSSGEETSPRLLHHHHDHHDHHHHHHHHRSQRQQQENDNKSRFVCKTRINQGGEGGRGANDDDVHLQKKRLMTDLKNDESSDDTDLDNDDDKSRSQVSDAFIYNNEYNTSATEWLGVTTNSDECSYSSDMNNSDDYHDDNHGSDDRSDDDDLDFTPATILSPRSTSDRISCTIWDQREIKKAQLSVLEISSRIIENVESMPETYDYLYIGIVLSVILSLIPCFYHLCEATFDFSNNSDFSYLDIMSTLWEKSFVSLEFWPEFIFGQQRRWQRVVFLLSLFQRFTLTLMLFMIFSVAERTFKQRFLYAKLFSRLTSSRRARKSNLPHFRLNKVRNIKTWLSVRSYLKKRGPQRSVDVIVSGAFLLTLLLLGFLSVEWLKDSVHLQSHLNLEALAWASSVGIFVLRYMTLGNKIHHKYRSVSVLITEQINLYLQIEKKPKKKEDLMVSNSVLKLAADLLKELETPFKISGLSANPLLFTTIKVVILSALSGILSEMLGFKLKLHKIKIK